MSFIVPAVLPTSKQDLEERLTLFTSIPGVSQVQIDVVDGKFASPASWPYLGPMKSELEVAMSNMLPELDRIAYEIDLMCLDASQAAEVWLGKGATRLTFHAESTTDLPRLLTAARKRYGHDVSFGVALNLESDLTLIETSLGEVEYVQFMGIAEIGKQGQPFDRRVLEKVRMFHAKHPELPIQVDGGISQGSAKELITLGVSNLIVGSALIRASDPAATFAAFEALETPYAL